LDTPSYYNNHVLHSVSSHHSCIMTVSVQD